MNDEKRFVLQFRLKTESWQEDIMDQRFEAGRKIYNALVGKSLKLWNELKKTKHYRSLLSKLDHDKEHPEHDKPIWKEINKLRKEVGLTEFGLCRLATPLRQPFKRQVNAHIAQKLAKSLWHAYEKLFYGNGKSIHFKKFGQVNSLEGQSNKTGIIFRKNDHICEWSGLRLNVLIDEMNPYEMEALDMPITYCRIIRQYVRSKRKYYLQVVFKGSPPAKRRKSDGSFIHILGHGDVGIDIGTSTVAYASQTEAKILELADKAQEHEREIFLLQRKLDRSRRTTNPDNFNPDGTCKKGRKHWKRSNRYMEILFKLKEAYRKAKVVRKFQHELLSNHLLQLGDKFYVEMMNFEALKKRAKETKQDEKTGRCKRKKRFGKSVGNRAPAMFLSILDRKLHYFDKELIKINTSEARASQFNHTNETYKKKKLSQRWNNINGMKIQRDMYSAFLIMNINEDLSSFNLKKCNARFASFLTMHDAEVQRLLGNKNLSSIGI